MPWISNPLLGKEATQMRKSLLALLLLLPMLCNIHGCGGDSHHGSAKAQVRILHASPDGPDLDIVVNDGDDHVQWADIAYGEGSGYHNLLPGEVDFEVNDSDTSQTLVEGSFVVEEHTPYSLIVVGFAADMELLLLEDDDTEPDYGESRLRIVDASPSLPAIDVYITEPDMPMAYAEPYLTNLELFDVSSFDDLDKGEYRIRITLSGEIDTLYDSGTVTVEEDTISTVVIVDAASGGSPLTLVALTDDSQEPVVYIPDARCMLRMIHASPDASFVELYLDGTEIISTVQFKSVSDYQVVSSGTQSIRVEEGTGLTLIDGTVTLEAGKNYTFLLMNFKTAIEPILLEDSTTYPPANKAKVRFIHASPDAPNVDFLVDGKVKVSHVPFKGYSRYIEFWEGNREFEVNEAGTSNVLIGGPFSTAKHDLEEGKIYTFVLIDELEYIRSLLVTDN